MVGDGYERTERLLRDMQVISLNGQTTGQADGIKLLRMTYASTTIVRLGHSLLSVLNMVLHYAGPFELE